MANEYWSAQRVIVTGGSGFLGSYVVEKLKALGTSEITVPRSQECDLRHADNILKLYESAKPTMVIHLAATVGGIGANQKHPGKFFYENLIMGTELIELARQYEIPKFVALGTVCAYPKFAPIPFQEEKIWEGYPEETNAPYGLAKKMLLVQLQAYRQEYGFNGIYLLPVNLYGPRDNFNPESSHVIPALIRKCVEAKDCGDSSIEVWGTGSASREFLYAADCADGILLAAENYNGSEPVNIGSCQEISIKELAETICKATGFEGEIKWDTSKPDGQPRRKLDVSRAKKYFGFESKTSFMDGLQETVNWYILNK